MKQSNPTQAKQMQAKLMPHLVQLEAQLDTVLFGVGNTVGNAAKVVTGGLRSPEEYLKILKARSTGLTLLPKPGTVPKVVKKKSEILSLGKRMTRLIG